MELTKGTKFFLVLFAATLILGFIIDATEANLKPTPRALWNLGQAYIREADVNMAYDLWWLCANYNLVYGANVKAKGDFVKGPYVAPIMQARKQVRLMNKIFKKDKK